MTDGEHVKRKRNRSPSFPFISLRSAIERAEKFAEEFTRYPARAGNAVSVWGFKPKSSGGLQTIAALKAFGLIDDIGTGDERKVRLTDLGWRILRDQRPGARDKAIAEAALKPKLLAEFWRAWKGARPPDIEAISELTIEKGFTDDAARRFLAVYDDTIALAKLSKSDILSGAETDKGEAPDEGDSDKARPVVGDYVQWESQGILQFRTPQRVTGISEDGAFVFVEGSNTGIPMNQVQPVQKPAGAEPLKRLERPSVKPGIVEATLPLDEGLAVLQLPSQLTKASYDDLEAWVQLLLRKAKRSAEKSERE